MTRFFISIADKVEDLEKLTVLMKSGFKTDKDLKSFSKTDYDAYHPRMEAIVKDANTNPELAFLMGGGEELYKLPFPKETLKHRGDTTITINDKKSLPFSDCVETSLRNFFWMVLHLKPGSLQNLLGNIESDNPNILSHSPSPYTKLKTFVLDEKLHGQSTHEAHCAWAEVVSGLNGANQSELSFDDVAYTQGIFEIRPHAEAENKRLEGIYNMFNVIAKLIPDPVFMESWVDGIDQPNPKDKKLVDKLNRKLTRLCTLTSPDLTHSLEGALPFANVVFFYKSEKFIEWKFSHNHFQLNHLRENPDWRAPYYDYNFENEWLGACFNRLTAHQSQASLRLSYVFNSSIKKRNGLLAIIPHLYHHNSKPLKPLLSLWLKKTNIFWYDPSAQSAIKVFADHFNDAHTRDLFGQFPILERRVLKYLINTNNAASLSKASLSQKDDVVRNTITSSLALAVHKKTFEVVLGILNLWQQGNLDLELEEVKNCLLQTVEIFKPQEQKQLVDKILAHPALSKLGWKTQWSLWFKRQTSWVKKQVSGI